MVQRPRGLRAARMCLVEDDTMKFKYIGIPTSDDGELNIPEDMKLITCISEEKFNKLSDHEKMLICAKSSIATIIEEDN